MLFRSSRLFSLFVGGVLAAPLAELGEHQTIFERLLVLRALIAGVFALFALEIDECVLRHRIC